MGLPIGCYHNIVTIYECMFYVQLRDNNLRSLLKKYQYQQTSTIEKNT